MIHCLSTLLLDTSATVVGNGTHSCGTTRSRDIGPNTSTRALLGLLFLDPLYSDKAAVLRATGPPAHRKRAIQEVEIATKLSHTADQSLLSSVIMTAALGMRLASRIFRLITVTWCNAFVFILKSGIASLPTKANKRSVTKDTKTLWIRANACLERRNKAAANAGRIRSHQMRFVSTNMIIRVNNRRCIFGCLLTNRDLGKIEKNNCGRLTTTEEFLSMVSPTTIGFLISGVASISSIGFEKLDTVILSLYCLVLNFKKSYRPRTGRARNQHSLETLAKAFVHLNRHSVINSANINNLMQQCMFVDSSTSITVDCIPIKIPTA